MSLGTLLIVGVALLLGVVVWLTLRARGQADSAGEADKRSREQIDTVAGWPPEVTRLLTSGERSARETLAKALPECFIFAQVPLARFIKVPRRNSYGEWLTRVGHLCADLVICDRASLVIGVVLLQTMRDSERSARRRARMTRVLKSAGVKVFVWREEAIPSPELARDQIIQRTGAPSATAPVDIVEPAPPRPDRAQPGRIPVPEVLADSADEGPRLEPPSSTWFDDLESGRVPLEPPRRAPPSSGGR
ncbi:MAG: DUF2726 domain-containing protein [Aquincola sp.]|nr:DUF2726 domain-containing protein [Aquincola sp.]